MSISPNDELMWLIAENENDEAIEAFALRYPSDRAELMRRVNLVRGLRTASPEEPLSAGRPFRPNVEPRFTQPRYAVTAGFAMALCLIGFAAFYGAKRVSQPAMSPVVVQPAEQRPVVTIPAPEESGPVSRESLEPGSVPPVGEAQKVDPAQKLIFLRSEPKPLSRLLAEIQRQSGLIIEIAPGTEDDLIAANYEGVPAMDVLRALGLQFGFTPLEQEPGHVLIVPALPSTPAADPHVGDLDLRDR